MNPASKSISDLPKAPHAVANSACPRLHAYTASAVMGLAEASFNQAFSQACENVGTDFTGRSGPYDSYSCGTKARPLTPSHDSSESEG